ncbi:hypothetical protein SAMN06265222_101507 [Neorhodopirellula lusitana]|uniref:Uncharacterized protein n=1 Tax=Neorhodopirellula lusitana TaxID=445327 RepID=A0ABY1PP86_9BACT|nr:hypothetical protein [Neorhodopirellula lusitana]SMP40923.1 hypothetical protein SAMN06265222_101507 [Neorhodopirellula lusitana]
MSDITWDWWFGDGPLAIDRWKLIPHRSRVLRRLSVTLAALGMSSVGLFGSSLAAETTHPSSAVVVAPVSFGWTSQSPLAMIVADDFQADRETLQLNDQTDKQAAKQAADRKTSNAEDERRRERLRELLQDDSDPAGEERRAAADKRDLAGDEDSDSVFATPFIEERLPEVAGGRFILPELRAVSIDQEPIGNGRVPEALRAGEELTLSPLPEDAQARAMLSNSPAWPSLIRPWAAPNTYSHPLYFEDRMLERHGHERWGCLQPIASGARFFATVPMLPYLTTVTAPCETVYSKGYYRAGSPVPRFYQRPPLERRAVIVEAASVAGGFIALP